MRLLNVHSLELKEFTAQKTPRYCILSHRWGEEEVSYKEFRKELNKESEGYRKIVEFCQFIERRPAHWDRDVRRQEVTRRQIDWVWIDTYKRSSAELSEAINSMYRWYQDAVDCFVYLKDVQKGKTFEDFSRSDWFGRGWTLQELLAPEIVVFCDARWRVIGHQSRWGSGYVPPDDKNFPARPLPPDLYGYALHSRVAQITGIPEPYLYGRTGKIRQASIAQRMGWASRRRTSRVEDEAYCLLGIFDINMPLIYGEGKMAFVRLQEEIIRRSTDQSILAWEARSSFPPERPCFGKLATRLSSNPAPESEVMLLENDHYTITNKGLLMRADVDKIVFHEEHRGAQFDARGRPDSKTHEYCYLNLNYQRDGVPVKILLKGMHHELYYRVNQEDWEEKAFKKRTLTEERVRNQLVYLGTGNEIVVVSNW